VVTPQVSVYLATSMDGFIAGEDDGLDWLTGFPSRYERRP
jgi:riboflavin biosynthesis pyrimidine reductase